MEIIGIYLKDLALLRTLHCCRISRDTARRQSAWRFTLGCFYGFFHYDCSLYGARTSVTSPEAQWRKGTLPAAHPIPPLSAALLATPAFPITSALLPTRAQERPSKPPPVGRARRRSGIARRAATFA